MSTNSIKNPEQPSYQRSAELIAADMRLEKELAQRSTGNVLFFAGIAGGVYLFSTGRKAAALAVGAALAIGAFNRISKNIG